MADRHYVGKEMDLYIPESWLTDGTLESMGMALERMIATAANFAEANDAITDLLGDIRRPVPTEWLAVVRRPKG